MRNPRYVKLQNEWNDNYNQIQELLTRAENAEDKELSEEDSATFETLKARMAEIAPDLAKLRQEDELLNAHSPVLLDATSSAPSVKEVIEQPQNKEQIKTREMTKKDVVNFYTNVGLAAFYHNGKAMADAQEEVNMLARDLSVVTSSLAPGLLPYTVSDVIYNFSDATRYFINTVGHNPVPPGASWRYRVETDASSGGVAKQNTENTEVATATLDVQYVEVGHDTYAGAIRVTVQADAFTDPDAAERNMAMIARRYAKVTEAAVVAAFINALDDQWEVDSLSSASEWKDIAGAVLDASDKVYANSGDFADTIWVDNKTKNLLLALQGDDKRPLFAVQGLENANGSGTGATGLSFNIMGLPVKVCPTLPDNTFIVGARKYAQVFETMYGRLEATQPSTLSREIALAGELGTVFRPEGFYGIWYAGGATPNA